MSTEAMKLALEVLKNTRECDAVSHAIKALEEALAKQEQGKPVAWGMEGKDGFIFDVICPAEHEREEGGYTTPLYTTPQQRKPLITEAMLDEFLEDYEMIGESEDGRDACYTPNENDKALIKDAVFGLLQFADEAAHGIKENT